MPSSTLSTSSCRTTRHRLAPSAARIAISRSRAVDRASSILATLAQAINSSSATAAPSVKQRLPERPHDAVHIAARFDGEPLRIVLRIRLRQPLRDRQQVGLHLFERDPRLQPSLVDELPVGVGAVQFHRQPQVRVALGEALRHDPDQRGRRAVQHEGAPQDRGIRLNRRSHIL